MNFTSINFLNNEAYINNNYNTKKERININNDIPPIIPENNLNNKDNNMSKSQFKEFINNQINNNVNGYYSVPLLEINNNNYIKESSYNNFNILSNNYSNLNGMEKIFIDDKLEFDISPQKKNGSKIKKDSFVENLNNLDSIDEFDNIINKNADNLKYEKMAERKDDKKRGKVMDRIVKGRARLNGNNKSKNDIKTSNIMEKSKLYEKVLGNSKNEDLDNINNINDKSENS